MSQVTVIVDAHCDFLSIWCNISRSRFKKFTTYCFTVRWLPYFSIFGYFVGIQNVWKRYSALAIFMVQIMGSACTVCMMLVLRRTQAFNLFQSLTRLVSSWGHQLNSYCWESLCRFGGLRKLYAPVLSESAWEEEREMERSIGKRSIGSWRSVREGNRGKQRERWRERQMLCRGSFFKPIS